MIPPTPPHAQFALTIAPPPKTVLLKYSLSRCFRTAAPLARRTRAPRAATARCLVPSRLPGAMRWWSTRRWWRAAPASIPRFWFSKRLMIRKGGVTKYRTSFYTGSRFPVVCISKVKWIVVVSRGSWRAVLAKLGENRRTISGTRWLRGWRACRSTCTAQFCPPNLQA